MTDPAKRTIHVVQPAAPFLAATVAVALVAVALVATAVLSGGVLAVAGLVVAALAAVVVIGRLRARVTVVAEMVEIRSGWRATVVPRSPEPKVALVKQSLGWAPVLRAPGKDDVLVLPLANWRQKGAARSGAQLAAALEAIPSRRRR